MSVDLATPVHQQGQAERDDGLEADVECHVLDGHGHGVPEQLVREDRGVVVWCRSRSGSPKTLYSVKLR